MTHELDVSAVVDAPLCACGYNLHGLPDGRRCPECGQRVPARDEIALMTRAVGRWRRQVAIGGALILFAGLSWSVTSSLMHDDWQQVFGGPMSSTLDDYHNSAFAAPTILFFTYAFFQIGLVVLTRRPQSLAASKRVIKTSRWVPCVALLGLLVGSYGLPVWGEWIDNAIVYLSWQKIDPSGSEYRLTCLLAVDGIANAIDAAEMLVGALFIVHLARCLRANKVVWLSSLCFAEAAVYGSRAILAIVVGATKGSFFEWLYIANWIGGNLCGVLHPLSVCVLASLAAFPVWHNPYRWRLSRLPV